jgi:hypothetical protein
MVVFGKYYIELRGTGTVKTYKIQRNNSLSNAYRDTITTKISELQDDIENSPPIVYWSVVPGTYQSTEETEEKREERIQNDKNEISRLEDLLWRITPYTLTYADLEFAHFLSAVFYMVFYVALIWFLIKLIRCGMIFVFPEKSKTYRIMAQYGDPAQLLKECDTSFNEQGIPVKSGKMMMNGKFVALLQPSYAFIAPSKELLWAYIEFRVIEQTRTAGTHYKIMLCFAMREREAMGIETKSAGVRELEKIKSLNPNMLVGFNIDLWDLYEKDFDAFKEQVLSDVGQLQERVSAGEQADMKNFWSGLEKEYER